MQKINLNKIVRNNQMLEETDQKVILQDMIYRKRGTKRKRETEKEGKSCKNLYSPE